MLTLKNYQLKAFELFQRKKRIFLYWEMGSGKTLFSLYCIYRDWVEKHQIGRALMICPPSVYSSVMESADKIGINRINILLLDSPRSKAMWSNIKAEGFRGVVVMSYDFFRRGENLYTEDGKDSDHLPVCGSIVDYNPDFIVFDEAHKLKDPFSKQSKKARLLCRVAVPKKIVGTGTPLGKNLLDLWNQIYVLDNGQRLGRVFDRFKRKYFDNEGWGKVPKLVIGAAEKEQLYKAVEDIFSAVKMKDLGIALPKRKEYVIQVPLTPEQKKIISVLKREKSVDFIKAQADLKSKQITKQQFYVHTLALLTAFRQVSSGFLYEKFQKGEDRGERESMFYPTNKIVALERGIKRIPFMEKFIVWTVFQETYPLLEALLQRNNIGYVVVRGGITAKRRMEAVKLFQRDPEVRCFLSNPKAGGMGLNLQQAKYAFYYSKDYSWIDKNQADGRNYRVDSIKYHNQITYFDIICSGTVEDEILLNLTNKTRTVNNFQKYLTEK